MGVSMHYSQSGDQSSNIYAMDGLDFHAGSASRQEATSGTVVMDRTYGTRIQPECTCLMVMSADDKVRTTQPLNRTITLVGRSRRNHIQINDPTVSVTHLSISTVDDKFIADDLGSCNGTYINGHRLIDRKALNDGDQIQIGTTTMQFAAGRAKVRQPTDDAPEASRPRRALKWYFIPAALLCCIVLASAFIFKNIWPSLNPFTVKETIASRQTSEPLPPSEVVETSETHPAKKVGKQFAGTSPDPLAPQWLQPDQPLYIQQALDHYLAGRLKNAIQILDMHSDAQAHSTTADLLQANRLLSMFNTIRESYDRAVLAQKQRDFSKAIECWDRLLALDTKLIGDRPSYISTQAKTQVQPLFYEYAQEALEKNNHQKARQLCRAILTINPNHFEASVMLSKIDAKSPIVN